MSKLPAANKSDEIRSWLNSIDSDDIELSDIEESCSSIVESSIIDSSSSSESGEEVALGVRTHNNQIDEFNILPQIPSISFNNVNVSNSTNVYLGNIYSVNGNLNINVINSDEKAQEEAKEVPPSKKSPVVRPACLIFPRYRWLAMDPLSEPNKIPEPVQFVAIGYTATTSSTVQARNIGIIRDYQTLNVEAHGFNDIIYNFFIGCDGTVYEGRGWGVEGEHTAGYNHKSIGIAFVGNFKHELPPERVFKSCRNLITRGITEGHLSKDYKLFTTPITSVNLLYEEFKKWDSFWDIQNHNES